MHQTFINLPSSISVAIAAMLSDPQNNQWIKDAEKLHSRYMTRIKNADYIQSEEDSLAYLALRVPATYAQLYSALLQIKETLPSWNPTSLLDVGSGPGVGTWAAHEIWPTLLHSLCLDTNRYILSLGERLKESSLPSLSITWKHTDISSYTLSEYPSPDLVIIASVLNELTQTEREKLISKIKTLSNPVILMLEPGTERGCKIIQDVTQIFQDTHSLIAPYINNSFVPSSTYWIHFSQRFIRPEFQRLLRQHMRESSQMASDWEDTKYTYVALSKNKSSRPAWGRCIGPIKKYKGYLEVPLLTEREIVSMKILKRDKKHYLFAKELFWGDLITQKDSLIHSMDL